MSCNLSRTLGGCPDVKQKAVETGTRDVTAKPNTKRPQDTASDHASAVKKTRLDPVGLPNPVIKSERAEHAAKV